MSTASGSAGSAMSTNADDFRRLRLAVERMVAHVEDLESRVELAERRAKELDDLLRRMSSGELRPSQVLGRLEVLEVENADMRRRLELGRDGVEKLLAKVRFLEQQR